jgi:hypothetical protein
MGRLIPSGTGNPMVNALRIRDLDAESEEAHALAEVGQASAGSGDMQPAEGEPSAA